MKKKKSKIKIPNCLILLYKVPFMKKLALIICLLISFFANAQHQQLPDKQKIIHMLRSQESAWNRGSIEEYMSGYWNSDSLEFIGKSGITKGWQQTLDHYKKSYPDKSTMGILQFDILSVELLSKTSAYVTGKWSIKREKGDISGHYTLLLKKINSQWVIVSDHSS